MVIIALSSGCPASPTAPPSSSPASTPRGSTIGGGDADALDRDDAMGEGESGATNGGVSGGFKVFTVCSSVPFSPEESIDSLLSLELELMTADTTLFSTFKVPEGANRGGFFGQG